MPGSNSGNNRRTKRSHKEGGDHKLCPNSKVKPKYTSEGISHIK
ncbi:MAG: hypothetical protein PHH11_05755 [Methylomonas sp.]|nr:hypothetical protein [Methylomonas sp.]